MVREDAPRYGYTATRLPLLGREQEQAYAQRVQAGDPQARTALILHNLGLVISIAKKYRRSGTLHAELVAAGNLALIRAVEKFDPAFDRRFSTYATWWIRAAMEQILDQQVSVVVRPRQLVLQQRRCQRLEARRQQLLDVLPVPDSLQVSSLRGDYSGGLDTVTMMLDDGACHASPCRELARLRLQEKIEGWIRCLPASQSRVLVLCFGLDGEDKHSLPACAERLGLSRQQVIQLRNRALAALRSALGRHGLDRDTVLGDE